MHLEIGFETFSRLLKSRFGSLIARQLPFSRYVNTRDANFYGNRTRENIKEPWRKFASSNIIKNVEWMKSAVMEGNWMASNLHYDSIKSRAGFKKWRALRGYATLFAVINFPVRFLRFLLAIHELSWLICFHGKNAITMPLKRSFYGGDGGEWQH